AAIAEPDESPDRDDQLPIPGVATEHAHVEFAAVGLLRPCDGDAGSAVDGEHVRVDVEPRQPAPYSLRRRQPSGRTRDEMDDGRNSPAQCEGTGSVAPLGLSQDG